MVFLDVGNDRFISLTKMKTTQVALFQEGDSLC